MKVKRHWPGWTTGYWRALDQRGPVSPPQHYNISTQKRCVPDPEPKVFGTLGSRSIIICKDPDPAINKQKKKKTLISSVLWLFGDSISLKNDVNVPTERNRQKKSFSWKSLKKRSEFGSINQDQGIQICIKTSRIRNTEKKVQLIARFFSFISTVYCLYKPFCFCGCWNFLPPPPPPRNQQKQYRK